MKGSKSIWPHYYNRDFSTWRGWEVFLREESKLQNHEFSVTPLGKNMNSLASIPFLTKWGVLDC